MHPALRRPAIITRAITAPNGIAPGPFISFELNIFGRRLREVFVQPNDLLGIGRRADGQYVKCRVKRV